MRATRNPTCHEPALDGPISQEDRVDILRSISFHFGRLDDAVYISKRGAG
ncbi:MAG: hypothetical protein IPK67_03485 [Planctomycetes bacterium]|nr:hypothetical protein [Planctomycetota bacterium]